LLLQRETWIYFPAKAHDPGANFSQVFDAGDFSENFSRKSMAKRFNVEALLDNVKAKLFNPSTLLDNAPAKLFKRTRKLFKRMRLSSKRI
jgi:hypothetical protein